MGRITKSTFSHTADKITAPAVNGEPVLENIDYQPLGPVNGWTWGDGDALERLTKSESDNEQIR